MCVDINENNYFVTPFLKLVVLTNRPRPTREDVRTRMSILRNCTHEQKLTPFIYFKNSGCEAKPPAANLCQLFLLS